MEDLKGKTAFITGGASGLGLAMAHAFGQAGMQVMLADIDEVPLAQAVAQLEGRQIRAAGVLCDVVSRAAIQAAAEKTLEIFGKVHVVCNNAGVGAGGPMNQVKPADWDWVIDVNLKGVIYGMETFLPLVRAHGEGGAFVNTASMAGMISPPGMEPYSATKFAVVAMSEGWHGQLAGENIHVAALCPGFVKTRINQSGRTRQAQYGGPVINPIVPGNLVDSGIDPERVGQRVVESLRAKDLYIFTHPDMRGAVQTRFGRIMAGFDAADGSSALAGMAYATPDLTGGFRPSES
ncbi:MAG: short-chain dehydrogenase [Phenylobacterium zucineum]|nr:MAG: short-chain dehydrogenase [Phenylobacterium zucineum]